MKLCLRTAPSTEMRTNSSAIRSTRHKVSLTRAPSSSTPHSDQLVQAVASSQTFVANVAERDDVGHDAVAQELRAKEYARRRTRDRATSRKHLAIAYKLLVASTLCSVRSAHERSHLVDVGSRVGASDHVGAKEQCAVHLRRTRFAEPVHPARATAHDNRRLVHALVARSAVDSVRQA